MKKLNMMIIVVLAMLALTVPAYASYWSGFCQKNGCYCHQYVGNNGQADGVGNCRNCGHSKASHS